MPVSTFKNLFFRANMKQLSQYKDKKHQSAYLQQKSIDQLECATYIIKHKDKQRLCRLFVVPGNCPALIGMPDI